MSAAKVTSADVRQALKLRYEPAAFALLFEVANGTGAGARRFADAVAFGLWPSHGHPIEGIEVKVSRGDFLAEMRNPGKSQEVFRYCDRWWLACPRDMVKPDELPPTWGLLELMDNGTLRQRVKAPKLTPEPPSLGFLASLLRRQAGVDEEMAAAAIRMASEKMRAQFNAELEREVERRVSRRVDEAERAMALVTRIEAETGLDLRKRGSGDDVVKAVKVVLALGTGWREPVKDLERSARALLQALGENDVVAALGSADGST